MLSLTDHDRHFTIRKYGGLFHVHHKGAPTKWAYPAVRQARNRARLMAAAFRKIERGLQ